MAAVGAADDEIGVEGGEFGGEDVGLRVEDVFRAVVEMQVPDLDQAVRVVRGCGILRIRCEYQL